MLKAGSMHCCHAPRHVQQDAKNGLLHATNKHWASETDLQRYAVVTGAGFETETELLTLSGLPSASLTSLFLAM